MVDSQAKPSLNRGFRIEIEKGKVLVAVYEEWGSKTGSILRI